MSNTQIPNLPVAISLNGTEELEAVQAGSSVRVTSSQIAGLMPGPTGPTGTFGPTGPIGPTGPTGATPVVLNAPGIPVSATTYLVDPSAGTILFDGLNCTVTLPVASSCPGKIIIMNTLSANSVVSASSNVYPLGGAYLGTAILAATAGKFAMLQSTGSNWRIILAN